MTGKMNLIFLLYCEQTQPMSSSSSLEIDTNNYIIHYELYMDNSFPTIDRPKPNRPSALYVWDNKCSALDAEWECLPYAFKKCEYLRTDSGWSGDYIQCLDDRFQACRRGAGCDYRYALTPESCYTHPLPTNNHHRSYVPSTSDVIQHVCNTPDKEYSSRESYQACVDKVTGWTLDGCGNILYGQMSGPVMNFGSDIDASEF